MTTIAIDPIKTLSRRLQSLDKTLSKELKNYVPDWWDDELSISKGAVQQILISLARFTNLDIHSVLDENQPLRFKESVCNYKHATNKEAPELKAATALVDSAAKIVAQVSTQKYVSFLAPLDIRKKLLSTNDACVNFTNLLCYCWQQGVPVLYFPELPTAKKMDAVVIDVSGTPVIAITKKCKHESEFLFLLAHEMGHIYHQHLTLGQMLVDESINEFSNVDEQESQANRFAITLLTGNEDTKFDSQRLKAEKLAEVALLYGKANHIDVGHIVLNWGHTTKHWAVARSALNILYPEPQWEQLVKSNFIKNIDENEAQGDQLDYLYKLINIED